jgi:hypothetical protein
MKKETFCRTGNPVGASKNGKASGVKHCFNTWRDTNATEWSKTMVYPAYILLD